MLLFHSKGIPRTCRSRPQITNAQKLNNFSELFQIFLINRNANSNCRPRVLTWKIRTQIAMQRVPLWPNPSMSAECRSLESCSNCGNPKRPKIQVQRMEWTKHGRAYAPIWHINASDIDTDDTIKSLEIAKRGKQNRFSLNRKFVLLVIFFRHYTYKIRTR